METYLQIIESLSHFLGGVLACVLAIIVMDIMKDTANKNVSIFARFKNTRLYCLSFVYELARDMKLEGKSDNEIQDELMRRYKERSLPFMMAAQPSERMIDAINFVGSILTDKDLLFNYVITPDFGKKKYKEMLSKYDRSKDVRDAEFALKGILIDQSEDNIKRLMKSLPVLCSRPYVEDTPDKKKPMSDGENEACLFVFLKPAEGETENQSQFLFKFATSMDMFINCLEKIQKCNRGMVVIKKTALSRWVNMLSGGGSNNRKIRRDRYLERINEICKGA